MNLWLLRPILQAQPPWEPWYDKVFGFVICARDEQSARTLAAEDPGDEKSEAWLNPYLSTCVPLEAGKEEIVMRDFAGA